MATELEKERKFLVKFPSSWVDLMGIFDNLIDVKRIEQTYLAPERDDPCARVRKTIGGLSGDKEVSYDFNQKWKLDAGVHKEKEHSISKSKYENYLKKSHPDKVEVKKTRFVFKYNDQEFELDVFKGPLKGLAILEIELSDIEDKIELPPYLKSVKEITKEKKYSNFELANKNAKTK
jgi:CYTH domain-containing protein